MRGPGRRPRAATVSGILVVDKAVGPTSFDIVSAARRALGVRRIGHAGTLDPGASGVLPLLVGEATKLMPYLVDQDKVYRATVRLGLTTDTHDLAGRILTETPPPRFSRADVERAARGLVGTLRQTPPMYSAVHHEGRRLYELARAGVEVERQARDVVVHAIEVEAVTENTVTLAVVCGKGTYVRVLAADLGAALGCGGAVERLVRLRVGPFTLDDAISSTALAGMDESQLRAYLRPAEAALAGWPLARMAASAISAFRHGREVPLPALAVRAGQRVCVCDGADRFVGVGRVTPSGRAVHPERILHADPPGHPTLPG